MISCSKSLQRFKRRNMPLFSSLAVHIGSHRLLVDFRNRFGRRTTGALVLLLGTQGLSLPLPRHSRERREPHLPCALCWSSLKIQTMIFIIKRRGVVNKNLASAICRISASNGDSNSLIIRSLYFRYHVH